VPTVALATSTARAGFMLEKTRSHMADVHGAINDGFVPVADAQIPGARLVRLDGMDHASLALAWLRPRSPYEAGRVVQALVALALQ
jgi:triacylglycerol lipase